MEKMSLADVKQQFRTDYLAHDDQIYWVKLHLRFVSAAVAVKNGNVIDTPPILKWAKGHELSYVNSFYSRRGDLISCTLIPSVSEAIVFAEEN